MIHDLWFMNKTKRLIFWDGGEGDGVFVIAGRLSCRDVGFVGDAGRLVFDIDILGHDDLIRFGVGVVGELTEVSNISEKLRGADACGNAATVDAHGVEAKSVGVVLGPGVWIWFGASAIVASGIRDLVRNVYLKRVVLVSQDLIAIAVRSIDSYDAGVGNSYPRD